MALIDNTAIMQIAIIVKDIEKTAENYAKVFGMPVPEIQDVPPVSEVPIFTGESARIPGQRSAGSRWGISFWN